MAHVSDLIATDIEQYLKSHEHKSLLRFITCGSVDDGKSTLIGRLLYESKMLFEDQLAAVEADSKKFGTQGDQIDFALLVDGLAAEREQGITIDVAYRFFSTDKRKFIVADTPGHEQYTRNMVTGASTADVAVLMVDARKGVLTQTRRHSFLVSLLGIRHFVVAINKMDLVDYSQDVYERIVADYSAFAAQVGITGMTFIPMSAFRGDNITDASANMPWYHGTSLMNHLETVGIDEERARRGAFRMPVQWVNRPNLDFRGFAGCIAGGAVKVGDRIVAQPSGRESTVARIVTMNGDLPDAGAGQSVTLTLADEIDISRGDVISLASAPAQVADQFAVTLVWMHDEALQPGRPYLLKIGARNVMATVTAIREQINVNTLERTTASRLELNGIAECTLALDRAIAFDPYADNRDTGGFILIDRLSNNTVGAGLLNAPLRGGAGGGVRAVDVDQAARAALKGQHACALWFGGAAAATARLAERHLYAAGRHTVVVDGSEVDDLVATVALLVDAGLVVLIAAAALADADRDALRLRLAAGEFIEVAAGTGADAVADLLP